MSLEPAKGVALLIMALLAIAILLRVLVYVHQQTRRVKELERQMKAYESERKELETNHDTVTYNGAKGE